MAGEALRPRPDGVDLVVRLTPRAAADAIDGPGALADGSTHLKARVRAVPEKGAANAALERLVAGALGLPAHAARVVSGGTARLKTVRLSGDPQVLSKKLTLLLEPGGDSAAGGRRR